MEMAAAVDAMCRWLRVNNVPVEGFRLVLSFPNIATKMRDEMIIARELLRLERFDIDLPPIGSLRQFELHGIDLRLESRRDR